MFIATGGRTYTSVKLSIIGLDNGFSPVRRQAIIWTSDEVLSITHLASSSYGINILSKMSTYKKQHLPVILYYFPTILVKWNKK